jgi:hypothetical protein
LRQPRKTKKQKPSQNRSRKRKRQKPKPSSGDCVNGLGHAPLLKVKRQVANQIAAPAELRTPNMHRAMRSLLESADGSMATAANSAEEKPLPQKKNREFT